MRTAYALAILACIGCSSSSGGVETHVYRGGEVMPIGGPPVGEGGPTPTPPPAPACLHGVAGADAAGDGAPDTSADAADDGGAEGGGADVVARDSPDADADAAAGVAPCLGFM